MGEMLSRADDDEAKVKAKLSRPRYKVNPDNFTIGTITDDEGDACVTVGDKFELYKTINGSWTVRLVGVGLNQYQAFIDLVPVSVQVEAINKLMESNK